MGTPIQYPYVNGVRQDPSSCELKFGDPINQIFFFKNFDFDRTRTRSLIRGNHPDPIAKTRGINEYKASVELWLAEWNLLIDTLGDGYGDVIFPVYLHFTENGFDPVDVIFNGCSIDTDSGGVPTGGSEGIFRKIDLGPLKIIMVGREDLDVPLASPIV